jgi:hypothetical protein
MTEISDLEERPTVDTPTEEVKDLMRQAREMIPVTGSGIAPMNWAQQIDFARDMTKAKFSIPEHLKNNIGDCLAIINMAMRYGLDPWMIGQKTYVQNGKLCFESQLYHAFAAASGLLKGDLNVVYEGEGDDLRCTVTGYLKGDNAPRTHRSERLKDAHPGHVSKTVDGVERKFVKGSPLWDKKPKIQLFYDTSRDWVRMYCPRATLGIYTQDEIEQYGPDFARDVTPTSGLHARLASSKPPAEGHRKGYGDAELAQMAAAGQTIEHETAPEKRAGGPTARRKPGQVAPSPPAPPKPASEPAKAEAAPVPKTAAQYLKYARRWIAEAVDIVGLGQRWQAERRLRNDLGLTAEDRAPLDALVKQRREELSA